MLEGDILYSIETLPPFPETSRRAVEILGDPNRSVPDIVEVIKYDQSVTANLLRMCNSAYFGFVRKITSLEQAVALMGHQAVLELAMISGSLSYYSQDVTGYRLYMETVEKGLAGKKKFIADPEAEANLGGYQLWMLMPSALLDIVRGMPTTSTITPTPGMPSVVPSGEMP